MAARYRPRTVSPNGGRISIEVTKIGVIELFTLPDKITETALRHLVEERAMIRNRVASLLVLALVASAVLAQEMRWFAPDPTAGSDWWEIGYDFAHRMIASVEGDDLFVALQPREIPGRRWARIRHERSGLECEFPFNGRGRLLVNRHGEPSDIGNDVGCESVVMTEHVLVTAKRVAGRLDEDEQLRLAIDAILQERPSAKLDRTGAYHARATGNARFDALLARSRIAILSNIDAARPIAMHVAQTTVDEWVVTMRYSGFHMFAAKEARGTWERYLRRFASNRAEES